MKGLLFRGSGKLSSILLTLQFAISVTALVMGIVFARNAEFQRTLDLGYDRDKMIVVPMHQRLYTSFRNEIISNPKIISAEGTKNHIGCGNYSRPIKDDEKQLEVDVMDIGPDMPRQWASGLLKAGSLMKPGLKPTGYNSIMVNQKLVNDFGWNEAVGKTITLYDTTTLTVIGVVEDFYIHGVWQAD